METTNKSEDLIEPARKAISTGDYEQLSDIICDALSRLSDFCRKADDIWDRDTVRDCCHEIGDLIYAENGIFGMQEIHRIVFLKMKGVAARYLECFWNGCGDGEWRG